MPAILLTHVLSAVETPLTATSLQWPFFGRTSHTLTLVLNLSTMATSLQRSLRWPLWTGSIVTFGRVFTFHFLNVSLHVHCPIVESLPFSFVSAF